MKESYAHTVLCDTVCLRHDKCVNSYEDPGSRAATGCHRSPCGSTQEVVSEGVWGRGSDTHTGERKVHEAWKAGDPGARVKKPFLLLMLHSFFVEKDISEWTRENVPQPSEDVCTLAILITVPLVCKDKRVFSFSFSRCFLCYLAG